jgi:hypothetical protein
MLTELKELERGVHDRIEGAAAGDRRHDLRQLPTIIATRAAGAN